MQTRKYPRSLEEAFGPYTSRHFVEKPDPMHKADKVVMVVCIVAIVALLALISVGWLPGSGQ